MKFSCYKADLADALKFVANAVAVKPQTPILAGVYLKAQGSTLELQANNFSTGILTRIPTHTELEGETVVSGKRFSEFCRNMPDETLSFHVDDSRLIIDSGGANVELLTMNPRDFPNVQSPEPQSSFKIMATVLRDLILKTAFSVAKDDVRPIFTGVFFSVNGDTITAVATNTHRLALAKGKLPNETPDCSFVVPADTLRALLNRINPKDFDNFVTVDFAGHSLAFSFDNVFMTSRLIDGQYPPYERIIPATSTTNITIDTAEFKAAIDFVALMAKETQYNTAKLAFDKEGVEVSANSSDVGGAGKYVAAAVSGYDALTIHFNIAYISEVLRVVSSPRLNIAFNDQFGPAIFTEPDNPDFLYVAAPTRA